MSKVISFIYNNQYFNASFNVNHDLVWSFKFALTGNSTLTQGGFTTFLKSNIPALSGGNGYQALGYLPTTSNSGIISAFLAIGFDTNGFFALSTTNYNGNSSLPNVPTLSIRGGSPNYNLLYTAPLSSLSTEFTLLTTTVNYCWLRFRLGDVCSKIYIDYRYSDGSQYTPLTSIPISLAFTDSTMMGVGISYSTPLTTTSVAESTLLLKSFTVEGNTINTVTTTSYTNLTSVGETILIAQSGGNVATQDEHIVLT
jgi:hypothetical protein